MKTIMSRWSRYSKRILGAFAVHHQRRGLGDEVDQREVADGRFARLAMVHGKGAQHLAPRRSLSGSTSMREARAEANSLDNLPTADR